MSPSAFSVWSILKIYKEEVAARCAAERIIQVLERTTPPPNKSNYGRAILSSSRAVAGLLRAELFAPGPEAHSESGFCPKNFANFILLQRGTRPPGIPEPGFFPRETSDGRGRWCSTSLILERVSSPQTFVAGANGPAAGASTAGNGATNVRPPVHREHRRPEF